MASKQKLNQEAADLVTCALCMEKFTQPKVLPCLHSFCLKCLQQHVKANHLIYQPHKFQCPTCCRLTTAPNKDVAQFENDFKAMNLLGLFEKGMMMSKVKITEDVAYDQCPEHLDEKLKFFCFLCKCPICRDCKILTHEGHQCDTIPRARQALNSEMVETMVEIDNLQAVYQKHADSVDEVNRNLKDQEQDAYDVVDDAVAKIVKQQKKIKKETAEFCTPLFAQNQHVIDKSMHEIIQLGENKTRFKNVFQSASDFEVIKKYSEFRGLVEKQKTQLPIPLPPSFVTFTANENLTTVPLGKLKKVSWQRALVVQKSGLKSLLRPTSSLAPLISPPAGATVMVLDQDTGDQNYWRIEHDKQVGYCWVSYLQLLPPRESASNFSNPAYETVLGESRKWNSPIYESIE